MLLRSTGLVTPAVRLLSGSVRITAAQVKQLRDRSGAPMMDCKKALQEADGDLDAAADWLRSRGKAAAAAKSGRTTSAGLVGLASTGKHAFVVELASETDFVARNELFQQVLADVTALGVAAAEAGTLLSKEALLAESLPSGSSVADSITELVATVRENCALRSCTALVAEEGGILGGYVHAAAAPQAGLIASVVSLRGAEGSEAEDFARKLAMQVVASSPTYATADSVPAEVIEAELALADVPEQTAGKPAEIVEKIKQGRLRKWMTETVLLNQPYVIEAEDKMDVQKALAAALGKQAGIAAFTRVAVGGDGPLTSQA
eukprot:PLAT14675.1.p3 GENE.PLAT14675.1~~PLAT14675.1.p3  ORF type:complete len:319 (+),score=184.89 PLAT14675.1:899-1855(+)